MARLSTGALVVACLVMLAAGDEQCSAEIGDAKDRNLLQASVLAAKGAPKGGKPFTFDSEEGMVPSDTKFETDNRLCEADVFARAELCPEKCPYAAEMKDEFCHFRCVKKQECGLFNTVQNATIPDKKLKVCRHCEVEGCMTCVASKPGVKNEKIERCQQCMPGYLMTEEGECQMRGLWVFVVISAVAAVLVIGALVWYMNVASHPCVNQAGVEYGLACRARSMLMQPGTNEPYPLTTNLMTTNVAGPGTMALFRFEFAVLVWAITLLTVWFGFVIFVSSDLLTLGNRSAASPQILCAVIKWGHERQMELVWTKVSWLFFAYVFSFVGAICYGVQQTKMFANVTQTGDVLSRYVAILEGLPTMKGSVNVEDIVKTAVVQGTGVEVVGVSVAWDFHAKKHEVMLALEDEDSETPGGLPGGEPLQNGMCGLESAITSRVLGAWHIHLDEHGHESSEQQAVELLKSMETTSKAYVVFATEGARNQAVEAAKSRGLQMNGQACTMKADIYAPEGILWENFHVTDLHRGGRLFAASLNLFLACAAWTILLYIPYAYYMASFSYANGDEPGEFSEGIFVCLVVASQIGLFVVSSLGAKHAAFHNEDQTQKAYTVLYNAALILNLVMDIALQAVLSYLQMVGVGAHVADGRLMGSLTSIQEIFESYPIQKSVGKLLFKYCWPCTFLVPFLAEPFVAMWLPWMTAKMLIGANPKIKGENAEKAFELGEMEQGRYADIIFNVILVTCIPFISPAYIALTFGALIVSHLYIYGFDQFKSLRYVRKFNFSGPEVHWLGMQLFAIPCSILAVGLLFKANQMSGTNVVGSGYLQGYRLGAACLGVMVLHFVVHLSVLEFFVRGYGTSTDPGAKNTESYAITARACPATYFSTNPVHCLRSRYIFAHNPPQALYVPGKEYLMKANPSIGAYYFDGKAVQAAK